MACYIVTFETKSAPSREKVKDALMSYGSYCPVHEYCWAIMTDDKAIQIRDKIKAVMADDDRLFVIRSGTEGAWVNSYGDKNNKWLKKNL